MSRTRFDPWLPSGLRPVGLRTYVRAAALLRDRRKTRDRGLALLGGRAATARDAARRRQLEDAPALLQIECERCGKQFDRRRPEQRYCSRACGTRYERKRRPRPGARKVERPPYHQLVREVEETSHRAVGRKYGVSDNAIRKWLHAYERELEVMPLPRAA